MTLAIPSPYNKRPRFPRDRFRNHSPGYLLFVHEITRETLRANPEALFPFMDNDEGKDDGEEWDGFAPEMRGESNAIGIRVKKSPGLAKSSFWTDATLIENEEKLWEDTEPFVGHLKNAGVIILPAEGWIPRPIQGGLKTMAPRTSEELYRLWLEISRFADNRHFHNHPIEGKIEDRLEYERRYNNR